MHDYSHYKTLRITIISDTHRVLDTRIAEQIKAADIAVHAGDICCATVLEKMQPKLGQVVAVTGNNDHASLWPSSQKAIVEALPAVAEIQLPGGKLIVEHGHQHGHHQPDHDSLRTSHPQAKVVVYGHTHQQICDQSRLPWVINPGAAGATRTRGGPSCLILTASSEQEWQIESLRFSEDAA